MQQERWSARWRQWTSSTGPSATRGRGVRRNRPIETISKGGEAGPTGVPHGEAMVGFAEAVVARDEVRMAELRSQSRERMGDRAFGDVCGVIANIYRMVRIADGSGIPLDERMMAMTGDLRVDLGINAYGSARNTPVISKGSLSSQARLAARRIPKLRTTGGRPGS